MQFKNIHVFTKNLIKVKNNVNDQCSHHIETSQLSRFAEQINWLISIWWEHWSVIVSNTWKKVPVKGDEQYETVDQVIAAFSNLNILFFIYTYNFQFYLYILPAIFSIIVEFLVVIYTSLLNLCILRYMFLKLRYLLWICQHSKEIKAIVDYPLMLTIREFVTNLPVCQIGSRSWVVSVF